MGLETVIPVCLGVVIALLWIIQRRLSAIADEMRKTRAHKEDR